MNLNNLSKIHNINAGYNDSCQITGNKGLSEVIDFGQQPLCDTLLSKEDLNKPENNPSVLSITTELNPI